MSDFAYLTSLEIERREYPFEALIMAAMRVADRHNLELLRSAWPEVWAELYRLYNKPGMLERAHKALAAKGVTQE